MRRWTPLAFALAMTGATLAACGDDGGDNQTPPADSGATAPTGTESELPTEATDEEALRELLEAMRTKPKEGGEIRVRPEQMRIQIESGQTGSASALARNVGDEVVTITSITPLVTSSNLQISNRGCTSGRVLDPQQACEIRATWSGSESGSVSTGVLLESDARKTPRISVPLQVRVTEPPKPDTPDCPSASEQVCAKDFTIPGLKYGQTHTVETGHDRTATWVCTRDGRVLTSETGSCEAPQPKVEKPKPKQDARQGATAEAIMRARYRRQNTGISSARRGQDTDGFGSISGTPDTRTVSEESGYDPRLYDSVETSLPVDRSRILTEDRIIKAVLETPVSNVMCQRITAQVERNVYAPEGTKILIPAGSRFIGECGEFMQNTQGGRVQINWRRFITPNGVSARIRSTSADANGLGGVPGHVEKRWIDRYGIPLAFTALNALATYAISDDEETSTNLETGNSTTNKSAGTKAAEEFTSGAQQIGNQLAQELQSVTQTLTVPAGTRFDIVLSQDLYFRTPYEVVNFNGKDYRLAEDKGVAGSLQPSGGGSGGTVEIDGRQYRAVPGTRQYERGAAFSPDRRDRQGQQAGEQAGGQAGAQGRNSGQAPAAGR